MGQMTFANLFKFYIEGMESHQNILKTAMIRLEFLKDLATAKQRNDYSEFPTKHRGCKPGRK